MSQCPTKLQTIPLHSHSFFSVLDGASSLGEYIDWAKENGSPAVGISDHGWAIGLLPLFNQAKKAGIKAIPGVEFYLAPDKDYKFNGKSFDYFHITVWCVNETGYRNLLKLSSIAWTQDTIPGFAKNKKSGLYEAVDKPRVVTKFGQTKPRITFSDLLEYNEGLVLGSGCLIGTLGKAVLNNELEEGINNLEKILEVYKGRLFVEIMPENCTHDYDRASKRFVRNECSEVFPDGDLQSGVNRISIEIARSYNLSLLLTIDSHFIKPSQKAVQDVLLQNGDPDGWRFYSTYSMLTSEQAWAKWEKTYGNNEEQRKIFTEAVENNHALADMAKDLDINDRYHQPTPEIPEIFTEKDEKATQRAFILDRIDYHGRMKWGDPIWMERFERELNVIMNNGVINFAPYFLFLEKWCRWAIENSILSAPGRGSGAGSLLCYLLKITHLDPFQYSLPFERFLSSARIQRGKLPDIDWDTGDRDPLVAKMKDQYGDKMAQVSTHHTLKLRSSIKDSCRALLGWNGNDPRVNDVTRTIDLEPMGVTSKDFLLGYVDSDGQIHEGHLMQNKVLDKFFKEYPQVQDMVLQLLGIPRAVSRHASAYVISDEEIWKSVPTCTIGGDGVVVTQYTAGDCEKAGLIKFDLLRVNNLSFISSCIRLVQRELGYKIWDEEQVIDGKRFKITKGELPVDMLPMKDGRILDIYSLPEEPAVFKDISDGKTTSLFQLQTNIMTPFCKRIRPNDVKALSDIVALVRPGPLSALIEDGETTMTEAYIARRNGQMPVTYAHPDMEPIVKDTYGVFVYQEQLQQAFSDLAGYSAEDADELREILAKKKAQQLTEKLPRLREALKSRDWTQAQIEVFISACVASSAYSFNRSHSASYGYMAYVNAYLVHYFPQCWWTAVLTNSSMDDIRDKGYARAIQDILLLPHVNGPSNDFTMEGGKIHAPIILMDGIGPASCSAIERCRIEGGQYTSLQDFFERVDRSSVNQSVFHTLILCDSFKLIEPNKTADELMTEYHYFKRVYELKLGRNKKGEDLRNAVVEYKRIELLRGLKLDIPLLYENHLTKELARMQALPIYRLNVHKDFKKAFNQIGVLYDDTKALYKNSTQNIPILRIVPEVNDFIKAGGGLAGWAGLLQGEAKTFNYRDKKTDEMVTACKMQIVNDGDSIEVILWPDQYVKYQEKGIPKDKIIMCVGNIKESREPGKASMSANYLIFI